MIKIVCFEDMLAMIAIQCCGVQRGHLRAHLSASFRAFISQYLTQLCAQYAIDTLLYQIKKSNFTFFLSQTFLVWLDF